MKYIAAGKDSRDACLKCIIHNWSAGHGTDRRTNSAREFIFRNEAAGKKQAVACIPDLRSRNRLSLCIDLCDRNRLKPLPALGPDDGVRKEERNAEVIQALHDIAAKAGGIRHQLHHRLYAGTLKRHAPCHDQTDISGSKDDCLLPRHQAFNVDHPLRGSGCVDAGRTGSRNVQRASRTLPAAHRQHNRTCLKLKESVFLIHRRDHVIVPCIQHHRPGHDLSAGRLSLSDEPVRILRPCQLFSKCMEAESVVDALHQDAARLAASLQHQDFLRTGLPGADGCGKSCGPTSDHGHVTSLHEGASHLPGHAVLFLPWYSRRRLWNFRRIL